MKYNEHPLFQISQNVEKSAPPTADATPSEGGQLFSASIGQTIKLKLGSILYPAKNAVERKWVNRRLVKLGVPQPQTQLPNVISWGNKGFGTEIFLKRIVKTLGKVETVTSFGCGTGGECLLIAKHLRPKHIIGCDYFNYKTAWDHVTKEAISKYGVKVSFYQMDLRNPLPANFPKADLLISISVLEHLRDFEQSLVLLKTLLRHKGHFASLWGPMWYSYSGDHIASELGLAKAYEHILLDTEGYIDFYKKHPRNVADVGNGIPTWLELGLHNFARYNEYIGLIEQIYGKSVYLQWCISPDSFQYQAQFPENWRSALSQNNLTPLDLVLTQASIIV
jgi:SAM-dependent methyltransferase